MPSPPQIQWGENSVQRHIQTYLKKVSRNTVIWWWVQWDTRPLFAGCLRKFPGKAILLADLFLLLPLTTRAVWCLGHFSSHLNNWGGRKKSKHIWIKTHVWSTAVFPKQLEFSRNNSKPFFPNLFHIVTHLIAYTFPDTFYAQKCLFRSYLTTHLVVILQATSLAFPS